MKLVGGWGEKSEEVRVWERRYFEGYPMVCVMNARGHRIAVLERAEWTVAGMRKALKAAADAERAFEKIAGRRDRASRAEHAEMLFRRCAWEESLAAYEGLPKATPAERERIALLHGRLGRLEKERELLARLVREEPDSKRRPHWRVRRAVNVVEGVRPNDSRAVLEKYPVAIRRLKKLLEEVRGKEAETEAWTRLRLGRLGSDFNILRAGGSVRVAYSHLNHVVTEFPESPAVPEALLGLGELAMTTGRYDAATRYFESVIARFPDSPFAAEARSGLRFSSERAGR